MAFASTCLCTPKPILCTFATSSCTRHTAFACCKFQTHRSDWPSSHQSLLKHLNTFSIHYPPVQTDAIHFPRLYSTQESDNVPVWYERLEHHRLEAGFQLFWSSQGTDRSWHPEWNWLGYWEHIAYRERTLHQQTHCHLEIFPAKILQKLKVLFEDRSCRVLSNPSNLVLSDPVAVWNARNYTLGEYVMLMEWTRANCCFLGVPGSIHKKRLSCGW
jgi:hypothetical protein